MTYPITADDYGLTPSANQAIQALIVAKKLERVSLLTNAPESNHACEYLHNHKPKVKIGVHLNIVEGHPITSPNKIPTLIDSNGEFYSLPQLLFRIFMGKTTTDDIATEFDAQINWVKEKQINIEHINTHQNIHVFMPISHIVNQLAKKHHIVHVRTESSIARRLIQYPIKFIIYQILRQIFKFRFGTESSISQEFQEYSIHPGTNYD